MAITYTDIENGETGLSVRTKINGLGANVVALDTRVGTLEANAHKVGFADYNDLATATTPISVTGGSGYADLTNDGLGAYSITTYLPDEITSVWNSTTNRFDLSELVLGDMIDIRLDVEITTTATSQEVEIVLELGTDTNPYEIPFSTSTYKSVGTYNINKYNGFYIGSNDTLTGGGRFRIKSDNDLTVKVNGWYCRITTKG